MHAMAEQLAIDLSVAGLLVAGVDVAGRGPLVGPVVAAAVILDCERPVAGLRDSKCLSARQRDRLARAVRTRARAFAVALADPREIDALNILEASLLAMTRAVSKLGVMPALVRVDGAQTPRLSGAAEGIEVEAVIRGDQHVAAISAASILAKVCRDRLMQRWHRRYPAYGFDRHKGYPTPQHLAALADYGPCPIHRRSFAPVRSVIARITP
jgi:ribonuclease HII